MTKILPGAARHQLDIRLASLRQRSFCELGGLPPAYVEDLRFGDETWSVTTYSERRDDAVRIVVQVGPPQAKFLLVNVQADGFWIDAAGTVTALTQEELHEFS